MASPDVGLVSHLTPDCEDLREQVLHQLNLSLDHLTPEERTQVEECLVKYPDIFCSRH